MSQTLTGTIVSNKMTKTVVVAYESRRPHPKYGKMMKKTTKIKAHTEEKHEMGEIVTIVPCRPMSKDKSWKIVEGRK